MAFDFPHEERGRFLYGLCRNNGHRWSVSLDLTHSHEGISVKNAIRLLLLYICIFFIVC